MNNSTSTVIWGTGTPRREFLHVDDLAKACIHVMSLPGEVVAQHTKPIQGHINVGYGSDISIAELAATIAQIVGYSGDIIYDASRPDGAPQKLLDCCLFALDGALGVGTAFGPDRNHRRLVPLSCAGLRCLAPPVQLRRESLHPVQRCMRACEEVEGAHTWNVMGRGIPR